MAQFANDNGIVFVADEIQSGFCRTGDWFASEYEGVVPDLITTAKGIAGGLPLAAVTGRAEIMDAVHAGGLGGTYGGNPVACAAALGAIRWMEEHDANARPRPSRPSCSRASPRWPSGSRAIGDIRGRGAMIAIELVQPGTMDPDADLAGALEQALPRQRRRHADHRHLRQRLPLPAAADHPDDLLEEALAVLEQGFEDATR